MYSTNTKTKTMSKWWTDNWLCEYMSRAEYVFYGRIFSNSKLIFSSARFSLNRENSSSEPFSRAAQIIKPPLSLNESLIRRLKRITLALGGLFIREKATKQGTTTTTTTTTATRKSRFHECFIRGFASSNVFSLIERESLNSSLSFRQLFFPPFLLKVFSFFFRLFVFLSSFVPPAIYRVSRCFKRPQLCLHFLNRRRR